MKPFQTFVKMQSNETKPLSARSFAQICREIAGTQEYDDLRDALIRRTGSCDRTVWNWMQGKTAPTNTKIRQTIAKTVCTLLNIYTTPRLLFP